MSLKFRAHGFEAVLHGNEAVAFILLPGYGRMPLYVIDIYIYIYIYISQASDSAKYSSERNDKQQRLLCSLTLK